jgi:hypothetical protein
MRIRWSVVLPVLGLGWFAAVTYQSVRRDRGYSDLRSHLEWATWQLDADPLAWKTACNGQPQPCVTWGSPELRENWSRPTPLARTLVIVALPAFLISLLVVGFAGARGANQIVLFFALAPALSAAWFYFLGRLADRHWRRLRLQPPV